MLINNEKNQLESDAAIWHYREVAKRTGYTVRYVKMVLIDKKRNSIIIQEEYKRVVSESKQRELELQVK